MKMLNIAYNGKNYTEQQGRIGLSFHDGVIDYMVGRMHGVWFILLISAEDHLIIRTKNMQHLPSKAFIKAVKTEEFNCSFSLLNNAGYSIN